MAKKSVDKYIFSTISTDVEFVRYGKGGGDLPLSTASVVIRGGANVPDKRLVTRSGVLTTVDADTFAWLVEDKAFKRFIKNGFIKITDKPADAEVVAVDMVSRDQSSPLTPGDFTTEKEPKTTSSRKA